MGLTWHYADDRAVMTNDGALFVAGWRDAPTLVQMVALETEGRRVEAEVGPLVLLNVAFGGVPKFADEVRRTAADFTRDATLFSTARAHVVVIPGFVGAAVMSFINTFLLLGRPPRPTKVFRSMDDARPWVADHARVDPAAIDVMVEAVRRRLYGEDAAAAG